MLGMSVNVIYLPIKWIKLAITTCSTYISWYVAHLEIDAMTAFSALFDPAFKLKSDVTEL